ncbi:ATP-dependent Clp protease proteolytic subunit [Streptomyces sp. NPDC046831]|uniref:ATP-dependent Clp protease proteolytic subunit n=1 Tax=Streptomyces sp. NPDC046831 TaxID=3154805 RepID=UPI0033CE3C70
MNRPSARHALPAFTERTSLSDRILDPYAGLFEERIVVLGTPIDDTAANDVIAQLVHLEHRDPDRDIALYVNSPGGAFGAMAAIYDTMRYVGCDVATTCLGRADRYAAVLPAAGTPGKRSVLPGARVTLGQPPVSEPLRGRTSCLTTRAEEMARVWTRLEEMLVRHTGRAPRQVSADLERETVLDAPAAPAHGLVDRVVTGHRGPQAAPGAR